ncbi:MAG: HAMP domain-containing sensor histidine kinase [Pseudomonadota bacterium]
MIHFHSLRGRLLASMILVFALGVIATYLSYRFQAYGLARAIYERTLQSQAEELLEATQRHADGSVTVRLTEDWQKAYANPKKLYAYTIFNLAGNPVAWSANLSEPLAKSQNADLGSATPIRFVGVGSDRRAEILMRGTNGLIALVSRGDLLQEALQDSLFAEDGEQIEIVIPFALLALALIWLISGWSLRPIARASHEAMLVGPTNSDMRISRQGLPREIEPLVIAVNGALDRLAQAFATERRLTADAAHALRTPIAVLDLRLQRAHSSGTIDWPIVQKELGQIRRLITQLLDLARKETAANQSRVTDYPIVNLSRIVREASAALLPLVETEGRRLNVETPETALIRGRIDDLRDMLLNLLENALIHGRGTIEISLRPSAKALPFYWLLEVSDEGSGVQAGQEEVVFERFRKLNPQSPGSGLGLAIVREVVRSHGGHVRFLSGRGAVALTLRAAEELSAGSSPAADD